MSGQRSVLAADQQRREVPLAPEAVHRDHDVDVVEEPASAGESAGSTCVDGMCHCRSTGGWTP